MPRNPEIAFYYPGPIWYDAEAMKNLLLFFDGIALLVPEYLLDKPERVDPYLAVPLREQGLLHLLRPEEMIDGPATELLATQLADILHAGLLDNIAAQGGDFHTLSMSRLGYGGDDRLARMIFEELKARGLARESEDSLSIPMHHKVRSLVLVLLAQILRSRGTTLGIDLFPATDRPQLVGSLSELLQHPKAPSSAHVVSSDLLTVGVDLSNVPLDEVLGFRRENLFEHRRYASAVRSFVLELSQLPETQRENALTERHAELSDLAAGLRDRHRAAWKKPASIALGAAGAIWTAATGDPFGALLSTTALIVGNEPKSTDHGAFSYIFSAHQKFGAY